MTLMEEKDPRFRKLERKTGMFVMAAGALIALTIIFIGIRREVFTPKVSIYFQTETGDNLLVGQSVKFKGFVIGRVTDVNLNEMGKVEVGLTVLRDYVRFIRADSVASLSQEGLIGDYIIEIKGGGKGDVIEDGASITFERALSLGMIAAQVQSQLDDIIQEIKGATSKLTDPGGNLLKTIENVRVLSDEVLVTNRNLNRLLAKSGDLVTALEQEMIPELRKTLEATGDVLSEDTSRRINEALDNVVAMTGDIKSATSQIPGVISDTKQITESIKGVWPISGNIEVPGEEVHEIDSHK